MKILPICPHKIQGHSFFKGNISKKRLMSLVLIEGGWVVLLQKPDQVHCCSFSMLIVNCSGSIHTMKHIKNCDLNMSKFAEL